MESGGIGCVIAESRRKSSQAGKLAVEKIKKVAENGNLFLSAAKPRFIKFGNRILFTQFQQCCSPHTPTDTHGFYPVADALFAHIGHQRCT